ncbi:MAG: hypothetical protein ACFB6S_15430 [Geminicoccaceae bacterium]
MPARFSCCLLAGLALLLSLPSTAYAQDDYKGALQNWLDTKDEPRIPTGVPRRAQDVDATRMTDANVAIVEALSGRRLTPSERDEIATDVARELERSPAGVAQTATHFESVLAQLGSEPSAARAEALRERVRAQIFYGLAPEARSRLAAWRIIEASDPTLANHEQSLTLLTRSDAMALARFEAADNETWPRDVDAAAVERTAAALTEAYGEKGESPCTLGVRGLTIVSAFAAGVDQTWPNMSREERGLAVQMGAGDTPLTPEIAHAVVGDPDVFAFFSLSGASHLDKDLFEAKEAQNAATALMVGDIVTTMSIEQATLSGLYLEQMARCSQ